MTSLRSSPARLLFALVLAAAGCGDTVETDAGTVDAGGAATDGGGAEPDAAVADGGGADAAVADGGAPADAGGPSDAGGPVDGGDCRACLTRAYEFGRDGGFVREVRRSRIEPCAGFVHTRTDRGGGGTTARCGNDVPVCDEAPGMVLVSDVIAAFAHPDVLAAFAAAPVLYGHDSRPVDGQVFEIEEVGGAIVTVGSDCGSGSPTCVDIPAGVRALQTLLVQLETERLAGPDCDTVFPSP